MSQPWHKTSSAGESKAFSEGFWQQHRADIESGTFWADRIKTLKDLPVERLKLALDNLPLPGAFREAAVATRSIIRAKRKANEQYEQELQVLYWLAAIDSFSIPYSSRLQTPGYNVMELVPGEELKALPFSYADLGYEKLPLLNKTDAKWLTQSWGLPKKHTTLNKLHRETWVKYENLLAGQLKARDEELIALLSSEPEATKALFGNDSHTALPAPQHAKKPSTAIAIGAILAAVAVYACSR